MTSFAADLLVVWLVVTAACSGLLLLVMGVQGALTRAHRRRSARRRACRRGASRRGAQGTGLRTSAPGRR